MHTKPSLSALQPLYISRTIACGVCAALAARTAQAQEPTTASAPAVAMRGWHAVVAAEGGVETNPRFQGPVDSTTVVSRMRAELVGLTRVGRTHLRVTGEGALARYGTQNGLDRASYTGVLAMERAFTSRLIAHVTGTARSALNTELAVAGATGNTGGEGGAGSEVGEAIPPVATGVDLVLPEAIMLTRGVNSGFAYRLSSRTTLSAAADATNTHYDIPELASGWTTIGRASVTTQTGTASSLGGTVDVQHATTGEVPQTVLTGGVDWSTVVGRVRLRAIAGAASLTTAGEAMVMRPVGDASAAWRTGRTTVGVHAGRTVAPTSGIGRVLATDQAGLSLDRAAGRFVLHGAFDGSWSADPANPALRLHATTAAGALRWTVAPTLRVDLGAFVRERDDRTGAGHILNRGFTLGFGRTLF